MFSLFCLFPLLIVEHATIAAGGGANTEDDKFLQSEVKKFLEEV